MGRGWGDATFLLLYSLIKFNVCGKSRFLYYSLVFFELAMLDFHPNLYSIKHICIFLTHSSSFQKMLTALFKLVWNNQKIL